MAKIFNGILGSVSGLVGPVVGAVVRGVATIRSRPKKSTKPAAASQKEQRSKFGMATKFIRSLKSIVDLGFQSYKKTMSPSNAAVQDLLTNAITGIAPNYKIDYEKVTLSKGNLYDSASIKVMPPTAGATLTITWNPADLAPEEALLYAADRLVAVLYDEQTNRFILYNRVAARSAGKYETELPFLFVGHKLYVWVFFVSPDLKSVSNSQYLGIFTPIQ
ncbi:hypothetical protein SAMN06265348_12142 [Pedobacter westerhofensis]|uniref:Uncharacterized protein n=1 Tax=Pedobacter westerhofensis TaxID=425512 RepID=A0A521FT65_9SPHI|nr:DUF6266 family protein [Pedobacter westerhofensis]SMO99274.1 hypothetical protein SAMN06265348_12142 [Pedobacter westerhofensis]